MEKFVNLHCAVAESSHLFSIIRIPDLFNRVQELGQPAVAITDNGNMAAMYEAHQQYKKTGLKFIPGNEVSLVEDIQDRKAHRHKLVLLAYNQKGYKNLLYLTAAGYRNSIISVGRILPRIDLNILRMNSEGLFCLSGGMSSPLAHEIGQGNIERAKSLAQEFQEIYGDKFFIELQPHNLVRETIGQNKLNDHSKSIAEELDIEMVATCNSCYLDKKDEKYHAMLLAIGSKKLLEDPKRYRYDTLDPCVVCGGKGVFPVDTEEECYKCNGLGGEWKPCPEFYLKSEEEVRRYFADRYNTSFADKLIDNSAFIASQCEPPDYMEPKGHRLPIFDPSDQDDYQQFLIWLEERPHMKDWRKDRSYFRYKCWEGFQEYTKRFDKNKKQEYWERLKKELDVYEGNGFCSYMLIVYDLLNWCRKQGYITSVGRGSAVSSLVAFLLKIHQCDPIKYNLLFERFLNKQKKSLPDIDMDFQPSALPEVLRYTKDKYGGRYVARISNIVRLTPKVAVKDISRSIPIGGDKSTAFKISNAVTAKIPTLTIDEQGNRKSINTIDKALEVSSDFRNFVQQYPEVLEYANKLTGLPRGFSVHAAGVIIADVPLDEYTPLRADASGEMITQFDKDVCEDIGLIKMDYLGLETLDIMQETWELARGVGIHLPSPEEIPDGDQNAFKMIQSGNVVGVFQLEGSTMTPLCKPMQPTSIQDIAMINAMGRPTCSPEERQDFINRRFGKAPKKPPHPAIADILEHTYGVPIYEEDLQHIGRKLAGWDYGKADSLRKLTKLKEKGAALAEKLGKDFVEDTVKHSGWTKEEAKKFWDKVITPFARYSFNLSHAIAYSTIGYRSAYYKTYARGPFFCALLNAETRGNKADREESIERIKLEAKRVGVSIEACDINDSKEYYSLKDRKTIMTGLGAIKGLGRAALGAIKEFQPFYSFEDFLARVPSSVNKKMIQVLAKAGAFDSLGVSRKFAYTYYGDVRKAVKKYIKEQDPDFRDRIDLGWRPEPDYLQGFENPVKEYEKDEWDLKDILRGEKEVLDEYISGTIKDLYPGLFKGGIYATPGSKIKSLEDGAFVRVEGIVKSHHELKIKKPGRNLGKTMAKVNIESIMGDNLEMTLFPDFFKKYEKGLYSGSPFRGAFEVNEFNGSKGLIPKKIEFLEQK